MTNLKGTWQWQKNFKRLESKKVNFFNIIDYFHQHVSSNDKSYSSIHFNWNSNFKRVNIFKLYIKDFIKEIFYSCK